MQEFLEDIFAAGSFNQGRKKRGLKYQPPGDSKTKVKYGFWRLKLVNYLTSKALPVEVVPLIVA
jgi:hypothetical protein